MDWLCVMLGVVVSVGFGEWYFGFCGGWVFVVFEFVLGGCAGFFCSVYCGIAFDLLFGFCCGCGGAWAGLFCG